MTSTIDASAVRQARKARVRMIRRRVVAGALALFVALWLWITLMLVTGHDPALARQRSTSSTATTAQTSSSSAGSTTSTGSGSSTSSSGLSSVTSSQS